MPRRSATPQILAALVVVALYYGRRESDGLVRHADAAAARGTAGTTVTTETNSGAADTGVAASAVDNSGNSARAVEVKAASLGGTTSAGAATIARRGNCYYQLQAPPGSLCVARGRITLYNAPADADGVRVELCNGFPQTKPEDSYFLYDARRGAPPAATHVEGRRTLFVQTTMESSLYHLVRDTLANIEDMLLKEVGPGDQRGEQRVFVLPSHAYFEKKRQDRFYLFFLGLTGTPRDDLARDVMRVKEVPEGEMYCMTGDVRFGQSFKGYERGPPGRLVEFKRRALRAMGITQEVYIPQGAGKGIPLMMIERFSERDRKPGKPDFDRKLGNWNEVEAIARVQGFEPFKFVFQDHPVAEQLEVSARTRVMLGTHGQALTWAMFMPDWSVTFEILIWGDKRPDYPLMSKWSNVHWVRVPLASPDEVHFPGRPDMTAQEKRDLDFYRPYSNYHLRQEMVVTPNLNTVEEKLRESKELLKVHEYRDLGALPRSSYSD